ncbi:MAG: hypothetical protein ACLFSL_00665 [Candidatus Woesearchaeota archaeon]
MRLGLMIEGFWKDGKIERSLEVENFIPWFAENNEETFIINLLDSPFSGDHVHVTEASSGSQSYIPIASLDVVYYGITGQKINLPDGSLNSLDENMELISESLDILSRYPSVRISNPVETMLFGISKDYLFTLKANDIPIVDTTNIASKDDLRHVVANTSDYVIKPKIAERGNGSVMSWELDDDRKIRDYAKRFLYDVPARGSSFLERIRSRQGLIAQRFNRFFTTIGEKKIYYVNGRITVSRRNEPTVSCDSASLDFRKGLVERIYEPTDDEKRFVYDLAETLQSIGLDIDYFRADIIGDGTYDTIRLNELELINPCSSAGHNPSNPKTANPKYPEEIVDMHNTSLLDAFWARCATTEILEVREWAR